MNFLFRVATEAKGEKRCPFSKFDKRRRSYHHPVNLKSPFGFISADAELTLGDKGVICGRKFIFKFSWKEVDKNHEAGRKPPPTLSSV
jgi:hypothetical protein